MNNVFTLFPAIDIMKGKVVRLFQGQFDASTEYSKDPVQMAKFWQEQGAQWLHIVDLDGAFNGEPRNFDIIKTIAQEVNIPIQVGGGIRNLKTVELLLTNKVGRVVLGTRIIEDLEFSKSILEFGSRVAVSLDCSNGMVAQEGWTKISNKKATDFAKELGDLGIKYLIYTDIAKDGMLSGPNFKGIEEMLAVVEMPLIASGGISSIEDVKKLKALTLNGKGLMGAITGKAIYEGNLDFKEALKIC